SGAHPRGVPRDRANDFAERFLAHMSIKPAEIARLQQMPIEQLHEGLYGWLDAATDRETGFGGGMLSPVVDRVHIPSDAYDPAAPPTARGIRIMIGTTRHEMATFMSRTPDVWANIDEAKVIEEARPVLGD